MAVLTESGWCKLSKMFISNKKSNSQTTNKHIYKYSTNDILYFFKVLIDTMGTTVKSVFVIYLFSLKTNYYKCYLCTMLL